MKRSYLESLWIYAPLSWAIIRTVELDLLSRQNFKSPILEVGCGDGLVTSVLFNWKKNVIDVGIDLDKEELRRAQKTGTYRTLFQADITHMPFPDNSFTTVFANGVLEHVSNLSLGLGEIARVLKKDGSLITTSPTDNYPRLLFYSRLLSTLGLHSIARIYGDWINKQFAHRHLLGHEEWKIQLRHAGLKLVHYHYYNNPFVIGLHDVCLPFSLFTKTLKNYTDTMVIVPRLRSLILKRPSRLISPFLQSKQSGYSSNASVLLVAKKILDPK